MKNGEISKLFEERWSEPWKLRDEMEKSLKKSKSKMIKFLASTPLPTEYGSWTYMVFGDYTTGEFHTAIVYGNAKKNIKKKGMLLRVHSSCATSELFHATNCECREELEEAMKRIRKNGAGLIIYMNQEGAGNGIAPKIMAYSKAFVWGKNGKIVEARDKHGKPISVYDGYKMLGYPPENRSLAVAAEILKFLGIQSVVLMTNNPKKIEELKKYGISVEPVGIHIKPKNKIVREHLKAKAEMLGHKISEKDIR
ncbi:MAG: hypothetical protein ACP5RM_01880 [Candidatus Micrarchaeia archaeon]